MESLPAELLSEIFSHLLVIDFLSVSEVCTTFYSIINSKVFLRKVWVNFDNFDNFNKLKRSYVNLKVEHVSSEDLKACQISHPATASVQCLKLDDVKIISLDSLNDWIRSFGNLVELHLEGIYLKNPTIPRRSIKLDQMRVLKFFYCTNQLLLLFTEISSQIETFKVCLIPHDDEASRSKNYQIVARILHNNRSTLRKLNFYEVNFDERFLDEISTIKLQRLEKLSMSFNSSLSQDSSGFKKFVKLHAGTLEKFKIRTFDHISENHLKVLIDNAENVRSLNLIICSTCDYETFSGFSKLKKLETLKIQPTNYCSVSNLSYLSFIKDKILAHRNDNLKHLTIEMIPNPQLILTQVTSTFPNLITLNLSSCFEIAAHAHSLRDKLKSLKKLTLNCEDFS